MSIVSSRGLALAALVVASGGTLALASSTYTPVGTLPLPPGSTWSPGADGRLWVLGPLTGGSRQVLRQDQVNGTTYSPVGSIASTGGDRIDASPNGQRLYLSSPSGTGFNLRWLPVSGLSTTAQTPTTSVIAPTEGGFGPSVGFAGNNVFVAARTEGPNGVTRSLLMAYDVTTDSPRVLASTSFAVGVTAGMVAANGNRVAWAPGFSSDFSQVFTYSISTLLNSPNWLSPPPSIGDAPRITDLAVDSRGTVIWRTSAATTPGEMLLWNFPFPSLTLPPGTPAGTDLSLGLRFNSFTGELLSHAATSPQSLARFSIPTPGAASALALGALIATRRRR